MDRLTRRAPPSPPPRNRRACFSWMIRLALLVTVLGLTALALGLLYFRAQDFGGPTVLVIGGQEVTVQPSAGLTAAERAYLRGYLTLHAADIEEPAGRVDTPAVFAVQPGETANGVAERLEADGLIADATLFRYYLRYYDLDASLEAGEFSLRQTMTIPEIAQTLSHAVAHEIEIRVTEGWRIEQTADFLAANPQFGIPPAEFLQLARQVPQTGTAVYPGNDSIDFVAEMPAGATLEGYLFPDTYRLPADATASDLIETMLFNFGRRVTVELRQAMAVQGLSLHGAVTLASIVEREAQLAEERSLIASVFLNRLAQGIKLDADPTVQYALGYQADAAEWWKRPLLYEDLETDSPYNTYRYPGLPPGPIASPGLASLEAVAHPDQTSYLYFVVDCTAEVPGTHVFAETFEEHQINVSRCQ